MMMFRVCNCEFPYNPNRYAEGIDVAHDISHDPGASKNLLEDFDHEKGEGTMGRIDYLASNNYGALRWEEQVA